MMARKVGQEVELFVFLKLELLQQLQSTLVVKRIYTKMSKRLWLSLRISHSITTAFYTIIDSIL